MPTIKQKQKTKSKKKFWIWIIVLLVIFSGGGYWIYDKQASANQAGGNTRWVQVDKGNVDKTISLTGTLNPSNQVSLTSSGTVTAVYVQTNDQVKKGQKIAQIDTTSLNSQLKQAQAQLDQAQAQLDQAEQPTTTTDSKGKTVTQDVSQYSIDQAQANVDQQAANVESINQQIADCTIKSPIDGTVVQAMDLNDTSTSTSSGTSSSSSSSQKGTSSSTSSTGSSTSSSGGTTIAVISNLSTNKFIVNASVTQSDVSKIAIGQSANIVLSNEEKTKLTGEVKQISYLPETSSGVTIYPVLIQVDQPDAKTKLLPGISANIEIVQSQKANVLRLPIAAITQYQGETGIYVKDNSSTQQNTNTATNGMSRIPAGLKFVPVTVGLYGGNYVEITGGLKEGDNVAIYTALTRSTNTNGNTQQGGGMIGGQGGMGGGMDGGGMRGGMGGAGGTSGKQGGNGGGN